MSKAILRMSKAILRTSKAILQMSSYNTQYTDACSDWHVLAGHTVCCLLGSQL